MSDTVCNHRLARSKHYVRAEPDVSCARRYLETLSKKTEPRCPFACQPPVPFPVPVPTPDPKCEDLLPPPVPTPVANPNPHAHPYLCWLALLKLELLMRALSWLNRLNPVAESHRLVVDSVLVVADS